MAFNLQTFRTRALTAIVFAGLMLAGLLLNHWTFFLLFSIIHFGCWVEYQRLVEKIDNGYREITAFHRYGVMIAGWCLMFWFSDEIFSIGALRLHELGWWMGLIVVFILPITELLFTRAIRLKNIFHSFFGLVYISLSWGLLIDLYGVVIGNGAAMANTAGTTDVKGLYIILLVIFAIWINDTMAYIVGSLIGKTPLSPISPKKTWEGTIGGMLLAIAIMGYLCYLRGFDHAAALYHWVIIAGIAAVAGTLGDLFESKLKRMAGVKDSGSIMPGHGGFLDRFDSMLVAVPFVWVYVQVFMR